MHRERKADLWKHVVRAAAKVAVLRAGADPLTAGEPCGVDLVFRLKRPAKHFQNPREPVQLRAGAPIFVAAYPDKDNAEKAVLDALGRFDGLPNLVWSDDKQVVTGRTTKRYADPGESPGCLVTIYRVFSMAEKKATLAVTAAEAWRLDRRRAKMSAQQFADLLGVKLRKVREWEKGIDPPDKSLPNLTAAEWCLLLRERHGLAKKDVSALCGLGVRWLSWAEDGEVDPTALVEWWQRYLSELARAQDTPEPLPPSGPTGVVRERPPKPRPRGQRKPQKIDPRD